MSDKKGKITISLDLAESDSLDQSSDTAPDIDLTVDEVKKLVWKKFCPGDKDLGNCFCCNDAISLKKTHVEFGHIIPKFEGGQYTVDNIRPVCITCNRGKGGMHKMNMYEYIVRNNMYGVKYLPKNERELYVYSIHERKKVVRKCSELLDRLLKNKLINQKLKDELYKIIISDDDPKDLLFQNTINYIKSLKELI